MSLRVFYNCSASGTKKVSRSVIYCNYLSKILIVVKVLDTRSYRSALSLT